MMPVAQRCSRCGRPFMGSDCIKLPILCTECEHEAVVGTVAAICLQAPRKIDELSEKIVSVAARHGIEVVCAAVRDALSQFTDEGKQAVLKAVQDEIANRPWPETFMEARRS